MAEQSGAGASDARVHTYGAQTTYTILCLDATHEWLLLL